MKFFLQFNNSIFPISKSIANAIINNNLTVSSIIQNNTTTFILDDSAIPFFQVVPTTSSSHFYVVISGKKYRINKSLYKNFSVVTTPFVNEVLQNDNKKKASNLVNQIDVFTCPGVFTFCESSHKLKYEALKWKSVLTAIKALIIYPGMWTFDEIVDLAVTYCEEAFFWGLADDVVDYIIRLDSVDEARKALLEFLITNSACLTFVKQLQDKGSDHTALTPHALHLLRNFELEVFPQTIALVKLFKLNRRTDEKYWPN